MTACTPFSGVRDFASCDGRTLCVGCSEHAEWTHSSEDDRWSRCIDAVTSDSPVMLIFSSMRLVTVPIVVMKIREIGELKTVLQQP